MAGPSPSPRRIIVAGASHRTGPLALRDRLFVEDHAVPAVLGRLRDAGIGQAIALSTCDRVEVWAISAEPEADFRRIVAVLASHAGIDATGLDPQLYKLDGEAAVRQLFAVAAALDSQVVGEPHVLGQVKAGHRLAKDLGMIGSEIEAVLQAAYGAAKRTRAETGVGRRPVTMAAAALQIARELFGELGWARGLLVGTGEMGALIAAELQTAGLGHLAVVHPIESRAETLARTLGCHTRPFAALATALDDADVVVAAIGGRRPAIDAAMVRTALRRRRHKPIFLIDAAVPGDVEPAVEAEADAFVYDLADLEKVALDGRADRAHEAEAAWRIVEEEVASFLRSRAERAAVPAIVELRERLDALREAALAEAGDDARAATRLLVNRLLHDPAEAMRAIAGDGAGKESAEWAEFERVVRRLFGLAAKVRGAATDKDEDRT